MTLLTDADIAAAKADNLAAFPHHAKPPNADGTPAEVYTCESCDARHTCPLSMDPYNTDGDCLAGK